MARSGEPPAGSVYQRKKFKKGTECLVAILRHGWEEWARRRDVATEVS